MLRINLSRSRILAVALTAVHAIALGAVLPLDLDLALRAALGAALAASLAHSLCRHAFLLTPNAVVALEVKDGETCRAQRRNGEAHDAQILGTTYVTPWLTVLNLRPEGRRLARHVLVVPDNIERDLFRQLRVVLRWQRRHDRAVSGDEGTSGVL